MDDWKPENSSVLEFDLNLCAPREFCEVFSMEPAMVRTICEYRQGAMHIFEFDQLLNLQGISRETIQQWTDPHPSGEFDRELQRSLSLQTETPEPLTELLDGVCRLTSASGYLVAVRDGGMLMKSTSNGSSLDSLVTEILKFIHPIQENMLQMNLGPAEIQVIGFESSDLFLLPAGGFYVMAMQPKGNLLPDTLSLWRSLATEIRRRYPPRIYIDNRASATENDIAFDCPGCHLRLVVDRVAIGYVFPCPRCKVDVTVPSETTPPEEVETASA